MRNDRLILWQAVGLTLILMFGFTLRYSYNLVTLNSTPIQADAANYVRYAKNLVEYATFSKDRVNKPPIPDAYWAPGYPLFLASLIILADWFKLNPYEFILATQILLGLTTIGLTFLTARFFLPGLWPLFPTAMVAISPHMIAIGQNVLTESLFACLLLLGSYIYIKWVESGRVPLLLITGVLLALTWLVNPVSLFLAPLLFIHIFFYVKFSCSTLEIRFLQVCLLLLVPLLTVAIGWSIRTAVVVPEGSPTSAGRLMTNLVIGMHSDYHERWRANKRDPLNPASLDEARIDDSYGRFVEVFLEKLSEKPLEMLAWYGVKKPMMLWDWKVQIGYRDIYIYPIEYSLYHRSIIAKASYIFMHRLHYVLLLLALIGFLLLLRDWRNQGQAVMVVYIVLLYVSLVYIATQSDPRYSFPLRPQMYMAAAYCLWRLVDGGRELIRREI